MMSVVGRVAIARFGSVKSPARAQQTPLNKLHVCLSLTFDTDNPPLGTEYTLFKLPLPGITASCAVGNHPCTWRSPPTFYFACCIALRHPPHPYPKIFCL